MRRYTALLLVSCAACVHTTSIRPDQLTHGAGVVRTPDGRTAEIGSSYDARLVLRTGTTVTFIAPVVAMEDFAHDLRVTGHNRPETTFRLADVQRVEIVEPDFWATFAVGASIGVVAAVGLFFIGVAIWTASQRPPPLALGPPIL